MTPARPSKISDEQLLAAVPHAQNLRQLLLALGVAAYGGNDEVIRARLAELGVDDPRFARRPRQTPSRRVPVAELRRATAAADSFAQVARLLGFGEGVTVQRRARRLIEDAASTRPTSSACPRCGEWAVEAASPRGWTRCSRAGGG